MSTPWKRGRCISLCSPPPPLEVTVRWCCHAVLLTSCSKMTSSGRNGSTAIPAWKAKHAPPITTLALDNHANLPGANCEGRHQCPQTLPPPGTVCLFVCSPVLEFMLTCAAPCLMVLVVRPVHLFRQKPPLPHHCALLHVLLVPCSTPPGETGSRPARRLFAGGCLLCRARVFSHRQRRQLDLDWWYAV